MAPEMVINIRLWMGLEREKREIIIGGNFKCLSIIFRFGNVVM